MTVETVKYQQGAFPKKCPCGRTHTEVEWRSLGLVGIGSGLFPDTGERYGPDLEIRNCPCQSSIAVAIEPQEVPC